LERGLDEGNEFLLVVQLLHHTQIGGGHLATAVKKGVAGGRGIGFELFLHVLDGELGLGNVAAGEDVSGSIAVLRPGVNADVRLGK